MLCSEWWAFEILTAFAAVIGTQEVAAQTIILQIASLSFMVPLGLGIASCTIVGNLLGAEKQELAIQFSKLALISILLLEIVISFLIYNFGIDFIKIFRQDPEGNN